MRGRWRAFVSMPCSHAFRQITWTLGRQFNIPPSRNSCCLSSSSFDLSHLVGHGQQERQPDGRKTKGSTIRQILTRIKCWSVDFGFDIQSFHYHHCSFHVRQFKWTKKTDRILVVVTSGVAFKNEIEQVLNAKKERQIPVIQPLSLAVASLPPWYVHRIVYFTFEWLGKTTKSTHAPTKSIPRIFICPAYENKNHEIFQTNTPNSTPTSSC